MLHLPVHPLYCQPGAEDLQILQRLGLVSFAVSAEVATMHQQDEEEEF